MIKRISLLLVSVLYLASLMSPAQADAKTKSIIVYFENGSTSLDNADKTKIKKNLSALRTASSIKVTGYVGTPATASTTYDAKRANAVKKYLTKLGVTSPIKAKAGGKFQPKTFTSKPLARAVITYVPAAPVTSTSPSATPTPSPVTVTANLYLANRIALASGECANPAAVNGNEIFDAVSVRLSYGSTATVKSFRPVSDDPVDVSAQFGTADYYVQYSACHYRVTYSGVPADTGSATIDWGVSNVTSSRLWSNLAIISQGNFGYNSDIFGGTPSASLSGLTANNTWNGETVYASSTCSDYVTSIGGSSTAYVAQHEILIGTQDITRNIFVTSEC